MKNKCEDTINKELKKKEEKQMTLKEIKDLWFYCYGEDLKTQYSGFYKRLEKIKSEKEGE